MQAPGGQGEGLTPEREDRPGLRPQLDSLGDEVRALKARRAYPAGPRASAGGELRRLGPYDGELNAVGQGELFVKHAGQRAEPLQMPGDCVGHDRDPGLDDLPVPGDLTRQVGACLHHHGLGVLGSFQDGERHADQVVEICPRRIGHVPGTERRREHFLGRGLAVGPGDRHDRPGEPPPAGPGQRPEGTERVRHLEQIEARYAGSALTHDRRRRTARRGRRQELVCVEPLAAQGHEQGSGNDGSRVGRNGREGASLTRPAHLQRFAHRRLGPLHRASFTRRATISRSSNDTLSVPSTW